MRIDRASDLNNKNNLVNSYEKAEKLRFTTQRPTDVCRIPSYTYCVMTINKF